MIFCSHSLKGFFYITLKNLDCRLISRARNIGYHFIYIGFDLFNTKKLTSFVKILNMDWRPKLPRMNLPMNPMGPELSWIDTTDLPNLDEETPSFDLDEVDINYTVAMMHLEEEEDIPV